LHSTENGEASGSVNPAKFKLRHYPSRHTAGAGGASNALRSILSRAQRVEIDVADLAQDLRVADFAGRRIAAPREGHDARVSASQRHDTPTRRFCRLEFLRLARAQFAVLTIEDDERPLSRARRRR
jgi:hypothetical protein